MFPLVSLRAVSVLHYDRYRRINSEARNNATARESSLEINCEVRGAVSGQRSAQEARKLYRQARLSLSESRHKVNKNARATKLEKREWAEKPGQNKPYTWKTFRRQKASSRNTLRNYSNDKAVIITAIISRMSCERVTAGTNVKTCSV